MNTTLRYAALAAAMLLLPPAAGAKEVRTFSSDAIELKADCVPGEAGEGACATCVVKATNRSDDVLGRGDITVSIRRGLSLRAKGSKKTTTRVIPKGSKIMNDDKNTWMKSEDHIVQALRDGWRVHEEIDLTVEIAAEKGAACADVEVRIRAAGRPKESPKTIIFVPATGPRDQQGLPVIVRVPGHPR